MVKLVAENIKKLVAIEVIPGGKDVIRVTGKNRAGKTSLIDSIYWALSGSKDIPGKPIRDGAQKAKITVDLGKDGVSELTVKRTFTENETYLEVRNSGGTKIPTPQRLLDSLLGKISFDPAAFNGLSAKDQRQQLLGVVKIAPDWTKFGLIPNAISPKEGSLTYGIDALGYIEIEKKRLFDERAAVNLEIKRLKGNISTLEDEVPEDQRDVMEVSIAELLEERRGLEKQTESRGDRERQIARLKVETENINVQGKNLAQEVDRLKALIIEHEKKMNEMRESIAANKKQAKELEAALGDVPVVDFSIIDRKITSADTNNKIAMKAADLKKARQALDENDINAQGLSESLKQIDEFKQATLVASNMPVPGLEISEDGLVLDGFPFEQASHAMRLMTAIAIGVAVNPDIRVLLIKDGEKLDSDTWRLLEEAAAKHNVQLWVETMNENAGAGIHIVEGQVAAIDGKVVEPKKEVVEEKKADKTAKKSKEIDW